MQAIEVGCFPQSEVFFYTPGEQAKRTFFYPLCVGHFFCGGSYSVQRNHYDSFLVMYAKKGMGYVSFQNKNLDFHAGDLICLDCYQPHSYGTTKDSELLWIHFDGASSREYTQLLLNQNGPVTSPKNPLALEKEFDKIISMISSQKSSSDALFSLGIVRILTEALMTKGGHEKKNLSSGIIEDVLSYINSNIKEDLPLQLLADRAGLSPYYFTRLFKKETGYTPHNYIIQSRINIAKFYIKSSGYSMKEICFNSGFSSESSFCSTFKNICGITPGEYRTDSFTSTS